MLLLLTLVVGRKPPPIDEPLPKPNGYDDLVAAGRLLPSSTADWLDLGTDQLRAVLISNRESLRLAREGLSKKCQVPVGYSNQYIAEHTVLELPKMKDLAFALEAEAKLAEAENRKGDAARDYALIVELGAESGRGGYLIHCLVDMAIESIGASRLKTALPTLDAQQCRQCLQVLEKADADRDSFEKFSLRERRFSQSAGTFGERLQETGMRLIGRGEVTIGINMTRPKYLAARKRVLDVETLLATRAFALDHGHAPTRWGDLVPGYLRNIPMEPGTNEPMSVDAIH